MEEPVRIVEGRLNLAQPSKANGEEGKGIARLKEQERLSLNGYSQGSPGEVQRKGDDAVTA